MKRDPINRAEAWHMIRPFSLAAVLAAAIVVILGPAATRAEAQAKPRIAVVAARTAQPELSLSSAGAVGLFAGVSCSVLD